MRTLYLFLISFLFINSVFSQFTVDSISQQDTKNIITFLSSDSLKGRGNYTAGLNKAAHFIADKFSELKLTPFPGFDSYFQPFSTKYFSELLRDTTGENDTNTLLNVVGVLEGRSLPNEAIIFSAHYDHLGVNRSMAPDSIFNGANDNASGTTAVLMLAKYFAMRADNERTLIFCAFAGEELGTAGSSVFSKKVEPKNIKAVINIEMIGKNNYGGKKANFYISGSDYSNLNPIFSKNLKSSKVKILMEPDPRKELFRRSDNYPFVVKGIPAHTIMCSDDSEPCYHKVCDDISRIKIEKMTEIIKAIAIGSATIISGKDTPSRIDSINK